MVNTVINWSISLGLGIAGTVESEMLKKGKSTLEGFQSALYVGIGLSGLGIIIAFLFCRVPAKNNSDEHELSHMDAKLPPPALASVAVTSEVAVDSLKNKTDEPDGELPISSRF